MELLTPIEAIGDWMSAFPKQDNEPGTPRQLTDNVQIVAKLIGRQNASYDHVWEAVEKAYPNWQPVKCHSYRRAILLAGSAAQHRTKAFEVKRLGRMVCIRLIPSDRQYANVG